MLLTVFGDLSGGLIFDRWMSWFAIASSLLSQKLAQRH
jgi:hypothetical protein